MLIVRLRLLVIRGDRLPIPVLGLLDHLTNFIRGRMRAEICQFAIKFETSARTQPKLMGTRLVFVDHQCLTIDINKVTAPEIRSELPWHDEDTRPARDRRLLLGREGGRRE